MLVDDAVSVYVISHSETGREAFARFLHTLSSRADHRMVTMVAGSLTAESAEELLFGKLEHGGAVKVIVEKDGLETKLGFELFPATPKRKSKSSDSDDEDFDDDGEEDDGEKALIEATPRKALPGPKEKKSRASKPAGAVPSVPPKKGKRSE